MDEDRLFRALAHSTRRRIIKILAEEEPQTYSSLLRKTGLATGTLNHHLEKIREILEVRDGLYDLTEVGWRAYQAMKVVEGSLSGAVRRSSPLDLVIRPSKGFREFAGSFPLGHVIVAFLIGIFSILLSLTVSDPVSVAVNSFVPPLFTAVGARLAYRTSNFKNFFASYPATLLPMILIPVLLRLATPSISRMRPSLPSISSYQSSPSLGSSICYSCVLAIRSNST